MSKLRALAARGSRTPVSTFFCISCVLIVLLALGPVFAQEELPKGSIEGTVIDESGAPVSGAKVFANSRSAEVPLTLTTDKDGKYATGPLNAGTYTVQVEAKNFRSNRFFVNVRNGQTSNGDRKLAHIEPGSPTLGDKVDPAQIAELPVNGRDALNTAQLEPGIIVQDGRSLEPTKSGTVGLSIHKASGLDSLYTLDGIELRDETKGGTTQNEATSSVQEMSIDRAMLSVATGPTSAGEVRLNTFSGGSTLHGDVFGLFRDKSIIFANAPGGQDLQYQRTDFGGRVGGALIQDKAFFLLSGEHTTQDSHRAVVMPSPFQTLTGSYSSPFRNTSAAGRLDWQFSKKARAFYRFAYNWNKSVDDGGDGYSLYQNRDNSPSHAVGFDLSRGIYSHSFRFGFLHYHNSLQDASGVLGTSGIFGLPANVQFSDLSGGQAQFGPSRFAPQENFQQNLEFRYDGSRRTGDHTFRFGASINRISIGGYTTPYGVAPQLTTAWAGGTDANPLDYPLLFARLSNGQRFTTEKSGFGLPHGGQVDNRLQGYFGDTWKFYPNLTITYGVHYVRDTNRLNSDLGRIPCSAVNPGVPSNMIPCSGSSLLDQFSNLEGVHLGQAVAEPNYNFAPQLGFAWDPARSGRTVIRGGVGVFFDTSLFSNMQLDRPARLGQGLYSATTVLTCAPGAAAGTVSVYFPNAGGLPTPVNSINGHDLATQVCNTSVGSAAADVAALQVAYQAAVAAAGSTSNPNFVSNTLALSLPVYGLSAFDPNYRTPRSYQISVGLQRDLWGGGVFTVDYVRNVSQRFGMIVDQNHVGDSRYLYESAAGIPTAALNAIRNTILQKAPACLNQPLAPGAIVQNAVDCYISTVTAPYINDFAVNGLDSGVAFLKGMPASIGVQVPVTNPAIDPRNFGAAFPGINAFMGQGDFQSSIGQAVYDGMHLGLKQNVEHGYFIFRDSTVQLSYTLSKFSTTGGDNPSQSSVAYDFRAPERYKGPSPLDRRHQISLGWTLNSVWGPRLSFIGHFASPAPTVATLLPPSGTSQAVPGEIFRTDFVGDGTPGNLFPFMRAGSFNGHSASDLADLIRAYDASQAGQLTPAGLALVAANLFTQHQLSTLRATTPFVIVPPAGQFSNPWFKTLDTAVSWPLRLGERFNIEPSARLYNVLNLANFQPLSGQLAYYYPGPGQPVPAGAGSANGTPP
ncbi:MAG TPA: carboxypeptidase-like regulatory domain-containing protein, partial [Terriglobales bacterium]|nr:carboxypeptidase-like regulatory domain-containing protein [Terriglobales bacterium]